MSGYVVAIDQGTTSTRAIVFDGRLRVRGFGQQEFTQHFPRPGWVRARPSRWIAHKERDAVAKRLRPAGWLDAGSSQFRFGLFGRLDLKRNMRTTRVSFGLIHQYIGTAGPSVRIDDEVDLGLLWLSTMTGSVLSR